MLFMLFDNLWLLPISIDASEIFIRVTLALLTYYNFEIFLKLPFCLQLIIMRYILLEFDYEFPFPGPLKY